MSKTNKGTGVQRPYKVRRSWEDTKTQKSSFATLEKAIDKAKKVNETIEDTSLHYQVFRDGICVYTPYTLYSDNEVSKDVSTNSILSSEDDSDEQYVEKDTYTEPYTKEDTGFVVSQDCSYVSESNSDISTMLSRSSKKSIFRRFLDWLKRIFHRR